MTEEIKHTPLPYDLQIRAHKPGDAHVILETIATDSNGKREKIARLSGKNFRANAEFILIACNSYYQLKVDNEKLREAAKDVLEFQSIGNLAKLSAALTIKEKE